MNILDIVNAIWSIDANVLREMSEIYCTHLKGEKINFGAFDVSKKTENKTIEVVNNKAIIEVKGPLIPEKENFFSIFFGSSSMQRVKSDISYAASEGLDMILNMNSPGSTVEGIFELSDYIAEVAKNNSIITFSDGSIMSGALLVASATNKIYISGKANDIGSVGVITRKIDLTRTRELLSMKLLQGNTKTLDLVQEKQINLSLMNYRVGLIIFLIFLSLIFQKEEILKNRK
jgi:ClpP class serine protease